MGAGDWIGLVERGYSLEGSELDWLRGVVEAAAPLLDSGLGMSGWTFEWGEQRTPSTIVGLDADGKPDPLLRWGAELLLGVILRDDDLDAGYRPDCAFGTASELVGGPSTLAGHPLFDAAWRTLRLGSHVRWTPWAKMVDCRRALATTPGGPGLMIVGALDRFESAPPGDAPRWARAMIHAAAGLRLRRRLARTLGHDDGVAVLALDGRLHHAEGELREPSLQESLRRAAIEIDRARGALRRQDPDAALEMWSGLVQGRWSLVDRFDRDGRHFLIARRNEPELRDPRALTEGERSVVGFASLGWSNKAIAYALGVTTSTVGTQLSRAMAKLGVARAGLARAHGIGQDVRSAGMQDDLVVMSGASADVALATLSPAEKDVARLAIAGCSNGDIAGQRRSAMRTVANQLASIYRKLGVASRSELAALVRGSPAHREPRQRRSG